MMKLSAIDENGEYQEITDLYWFEENGVHDFDGEGHWHKYRFTMETNGIIFVIEKDAVFKFKQPTN